MSQNLALHNNHLPVLHLPTLQLNNQTLQSYFLHFLFLMNQFLGLKSLFLNFKLLTFCCLKFEWRSQFFHLQIFLLIEPYALMLDYDWSRVLVCPTSFFCFLFFIFQFCIHQSHQKNFILAWSHFFFQFLSLNSNFAFLFIFWDLLILLLFFFQIPFLN